MSDLKPYKYTSALHIATNLWDPKISHKQWTITVDHGTVQSADYLRIENQYWPAMEPIGADGHPVALLSTPLSETLINLIDCYY